LAIGPPKGDRSHARPACLSPLWPKVGMYLPRWLIYLSPSYPIIAFVACCLRDLARTDVDVRNFSKSVWAALCVISVPLGGIPYFMSGRAPQ
jgi:hypothetical protein